VLLVFGDGKRIFTRAVRKWKNGGKPILRIQKRNYETWNLIGLPYGTVLEVPPAAAAGNVGANGNDGDTNNKSNSAACRRCLVPLPEGEGLLPSYPSSLLSEQGKLPLSGEERQEQEQQQQQQDREESGGNGDPGLESPEARADDSTFPRDNRHIVDDNTSQALTLRDLQDLRDAGTDGSVIVDKLIGHSSTFQSKSDFSKVKYVVKKQIKYQPRCRLVRCTASTICESMYVREPKRLMNVRDDTLAQILSYSNVSAGCQALIFETCLGIVTGAVAHRMGGYGRILSVYEGQQPSYDDVLRRFNLSFEENYSIKWIHAGDVFQNDDAVDEPGTTNGNSHISKEGGKETEVDVEKLEREAMSEWPCPLQDHTRAYIKRDMPSSEERFEFLLKRSSRFARKLTRHTPCEAKHWLKSRQCDSLIIVTKYDPLRTLLQMFPYLAPSCPFVLYSEFIEPLTECFLRLQSQNLAINLRLSDTWTREYQVLPGRTHPNMNMSQSGGFILTGIKLDPNTGTNELSEELLKEIRAEIGGRRGRKPKNKRGPGRDAATSPQTKRPRVGV